MSNLNERQSNFIDLFIETGCASTAYEAVGYSPDRSNAHKLVPKLSNEINNRLQSRMSLKTSTALSILEELMTNEDNAPRDRLNAVNSWLDRTNVARASTSKVDVTQTDQIQPPPPDRRYIRNNHQMIIIGNGIMFPCKVPPTEGEAKLPFAYSDPETAKYLKEHGYPDDTCDPDEGNTVYIEH